MMKKTWLFILSLWIATFTFGLWGLSLLPPPTEGSMLPIKDGLNSFFTIAIMLLGEATWTTQIKIPWQLELSRYLAIISTFAYVTILFLQDKVSTLYRWMAKFSSNNIIIIGEAETCLELGRALLGRKKKIICITLDELPPNQNSSEYMKFVFISGAKDMSDALRRANVIKSSFIMIWANDPNTNDEISWLINDNFGPEITHESGCKVLVKTNPLTPATIDSGLSKSVLSSTLQTYPILSDAINVQSILKSFPPELYSDVLGAKRVHIAIHGFGLYGTTFLLEAIRQGIYRHTDRKLIVTIFDKSNGENFHAFQRAFPSIKDFVDIQYQNIDINDDVFIQLESMNDGAPTLHVISPDFCLDEIQYAQLLRSSTTSQKNKNAPIILADMVADETKLERLNARRIYCYTPKDISHTIDHFLDEKIERVAKAFHNDYVQSNDISLKKHPEQSWEFLPNWARVSNRSVAAHLNTKLRAINYVETDRFKTIHLSEDDVETLASMEHKRWVIEKVTMGYQKSQTRNDNLLLHNKLNDWNDLTDQDKNNNFNQVKSIPSILNDQLNKQIKPVFTLGVTGHRALPKGQKLDALKDKILSKMRELRAKYPDHHFHVLSSMADGADRLVVDCATEVLDASFDIILPMPEEYYLDDFEKHSDIPYTGREDFFKWKHKAEHVLEVPLRFATSKELPMGGEPRNLQYALGGAYVMERSNLLIAIWDGQPAKGTGGTGEVVDWSVKGEVPENLKVSAGFFSAPARAEPLIIWEE